MMAEVCREQLTPVQMNTNMEIKALRKLVEEQRKVMDDYRQKLQKAMEGIEDLRLSTIYNRQDKDKASEGYQRELARLQ